MAIFKVVHESNSERVYFACQNRGLNLPELENFAGPNIDRFTKDNRGRYTIYLKSHPDIPVTPGDWILLSEDWEDGLPKVLVLAHRLKDNLLDYVFLGEHVPPLNISSSADELKMLNIESRRRLVEDYPTLRDQFAMAVLPQMLNRCYAPAGDCPGEQALKAAVLASYDAADIALKHRQFSTEIPDAVEQMEKLEFGENVLPGGE